MAHYYGPREYGARDDYADYGDYPHQDYASRGAYYPRGRYMDRYGAAPGPSPAGYEVMCPPPGPYEMPYEGAPPPPPPMGGPAQPDVWPQFQAEFMTQAESILFDWWNMQRRDVDCVAKLERILFPPPAPEYLPPAQQEHPVKAPPMPQAEPTKPVEPVAPAKSIDTSPHFPPQDSAPVSPATTAAPIVQTPDVAEPPVAEPPVAKPPSGPRVLYSMAINGKTEDEKRYVDVIDMGMSIKALHNLLADEDAQKLMFFLNRHMKDIETGCIQGAYLTSPGAEDAAKDLPPEKLRAVIASLPSDPDREVAAEYPPEVAEKIRNLFRTFTGLELKCAKLDGKAPKFVVFEEIPPKSRRQYLCDVEDPETWHFMLVEGGPLKISVGSVDTGCHPQNALIFEDLEGAYKTWTLINEHDEPLTVGVICQ